MAVAVSDFCRRARAPAGAPEVREALATLAEADDFRVRELTDREPEASPLGPFAVVDVLRGASQTLAAQRQSVGYYELVRDVVTLRALPPEEAPVAHAATPVATPPAETARAPGEAPPRVAVTQPATVAERIAPKKRTAEAGPTEAAPAEAAFPRRELPRPRGRFTNVPAPRTPISELASASERETVETLTSQHPHRFSLLRALAGTYASSRGGDLQPEDVLWVLQEHGLKEELEAREHTHVLEAYAGQRGATGRVAWTLGLSPAELGQLVRALGIQTEVEELRERFRREALSPRTLTARLDLLGRDKYLADLGIKKRFQEMLTADLKAALAQARSQVSDASDVVGRLSRESGAPVELLHRAIERLGLQRELRTSPSAPPVP
ncbi:MAG: hypothetical protein L0Y66_12105 [Myxococcaceae bacterium]|nr:hypothetical protein [Myxococcaceae bacterium]MCI0674020.1 hypothetical protein [Myxococcaceae bacterium]